MGFRFAPEAHFYFGSLSRQTQRLENTAYDQFSIIILRTSTTNRANFIRLRTVLRGSVVRGQKNPLHHDLPIRLRKALKQSGLTRTALARLAGVSHPVVGSLETRQSLTTVSTIVRLALALGVSSSWLAYGLGEQNGQGNAASCDGMDERLRLARKARGHTRTELARLAEVTPGTIAHIEGGGQAKVNTVESLAKALEVSPGWLAFGIGPEVLPSPRRGRPPAQSAAPTG